MEKTIPYLLVGLGLITLSVNGFLYLKRTTSNVFSKWDYSRYLIGIAILVALLAGPIVTIWEIGTPTGVMVVVIALLLAGLAGGELLKRFIFQSYMRPGSIAYHPFLVKYWPSWIIRDGRLVVDRATVVRFGLVESEFDLSLSILQNKGEKELDLRNASTESKQAILQNVDLKYPMPRHQEMAMTMSGTLLQDSPQLRIRCIAPDFMPPEQESPLCPVKSLTDAPIRFPLVPKSPGNKTILFRLIDEAGVERGSIQMGCTVKSKGSVIGQFFSSWWWTILVMLLGIFSSLFLMAEKLKEFFQR